MGGFRSIPLVLACALPLAVAAQEPDRIDRDPGRVTVDVVALTALSLHASFRSYPVRRGRLVRLHGKLVSLACTVALLYLWSNGWIGLRTWAY